MDKEVGTEKAGIQAGAKGRIAPGVKVGVLNIGGKDDGVVLTVHLAVEGNEVAGFGHFTDSINNQSFAVTLEGKTHATGLGPAKQLFALSGQAFPPYRLGAPNIPTLNIVLNNIWGENGEADYTVWRDTPDIQKHSGIVHAHWE